MEILRNLRIATGCYWLGAQIQGLVVSLVEVVQWNFLVQNPWDIFGFLNKGQFQSIHMTLPWDWYTYAYMETIKINHPWIGKYTSPMDPSWDSTSECFSVFLPVGWLIFFTLAQESN